MPYEKMCINKISVENWLFLSFWEILTDSKNKYNEESPLQVIYFVSILKNEITSSLHIDHFIK